MIKFWKLGYFHNINIHVVFLFNNFSFYIYSTVKYLHRIHWRFYMLLYADFFYVKICDSHYDKIWKTRDYFQNINTTVFFFIKLTSLYLHFTHYRIYVLISPKSNKMIVIHSYHDNILASKKGQLWNFIELLFLYIVFLYILLVD